jgi:putative transposase
VTARTNAKALLFQPAGAKVLFLETLGKAKGKFGFQIDNFVLMENHVHLLLWPAAGDELPLLMKWLLGVYAEAYNRAFDLWGHFWGGRYFSRPLGQFGEYLAVSDYIDGNPVEAGLVPTATDWEWGGLFLHREGRAELTQAPEWLLLARPEHGVRHRAAAGGRPQQPCGVCPLVLGGA